MKIELLHAMRQAKKHFRSKCLLLLLALLVPAYACAAEVSVAFTNVADSVAGQDKWEGRYTIKGPLGNFASVNLQFPAAQFGSLAVKTNASPAQLSALATSPNPLLASAGQVLLTATGALDASFQSTVDVSFVWLGTGSPQTQPYELLDANFNVLGNAIASGGTSVSTRIEAQWNLLGNGQSTPLALATVFGNLDAPVAGVTTNIRSIWKWNPGSLAWQFYSPQLTLADMTAFAASKGYELITSIAPGEGYWVNSTVQFDLQTQAGTDFIYSASTYAALPRSWNLVAQGASLTPSAFNDSVSQTAPVAGVVKTDTFVTLWAWNAQLLQWYYYSPVLEASGGLSAVKAYAQSKSYLHFQDDGKMLGQGVGFWINKVAASATSVTPSLEAQWNLIGNGLSTPLSVAAVFGNLDAPVAAVTPNIRSIWKWNPGNLTWQFYSPQQTLAEMSAFAASKGYELMTSIAPGEGYWVNSAAKFDLPAQTGSAFTFAPATYAALPRSWNLIAQGGSLTPSAFNDSVSQTAPVAGVVKTDTFATLWAWNAQLLQWYYYSPALEASGGLPAVKAYAQSKSYLHFQDDAKMLSPGVGFWVNKSN